jgi:hypothetical protein
VTIARPDIVAGQPKGLASEKTILFLMETLVEPTLGRSALKICVFVAVISDMLFLGLDVLRTSDASVDCGRHVLRNWAEKSRCGFP